MTLYSTLYDRALAQITDPLLAQLPEEDLENMLHDWLMNAIIEPVVGEYLVPVADGIYKEQAQRLGKTYPMSFADNALQFRSGNPTPCGDADGILAHGKKFYDELSPETSEFFNKMLEDELLDLLSTTGKAGGGYCTSLPDYEVPFIFAKNDDRLFYHRDGPKSGWGILGRH